MDPAQHGHRLRSAEDPLELGQEAEPVVCTHTRMTAIAWSASLQCISSMSAMEEKIRLYRLLMVILGELSLPYGHRHTIYVLCDDLTLT